MRWSSVVGVIGLSSTSALLTGCLTMGVVDRSTGRTKAHARITQVEQAAALGADLYLRLGVQSKKYPEIRTVVLKVPLADIGVQHPNPSMVLLEDDDLRFQPPALGIWMPDGIIPREASPIQTLYLDETSEEALNQRLASLPPGLHVLIAPARLWYPEFVPKAPVLNGVVPEFSHIILANRIEGRPLQESHLSSFNEARKKNRAWLLLTPLTVVGDVLTSPFQLLKIVGP